VERATHRLRQRRRQARVEHDGTERQDIERELLRASLAGLEADGPDDEVDLRVNMASCARTHEKVDEPDEVEVVGCGVRLVRS